MPPFVTAPLKSLQELADWDSAETPVYVTIRRDSVKKPEKSRPKVIVCHDFKGGYNEDASWQGNHQFNAYRFDHWSSIDVFIYFSHWRITIPPPTWINAAHTNNVKILGTFITEWDEGIEENLRLIYGVDDPSSGTVSDQFAVKLAQIAKHYAFDGWLLNIESPLRNAQQAHDMVKFVEILTDTMHEYVPGSLVIWYDSLTTEGKIEWQDGLTSRNRPFFEAADAIFTNYTWKAHQPAHDSQEAGDKRTDVFVGIDFWGRNTFGGGGFNVHKALRVIKDAGTSVAMFAPGWSYEHLDSSMFELYEACLWHGIHKMDPSKIVLPAKDVEENASTNPDENDLGCITDYIKPRASITSLYSNFCLGAGLEYYVGGNRVSSTPWHHIGRTSLLPSFNHRPSTILVLDGSNLRPDRTTCAYTSKLETGKAFWGGSSLVIRGSDRPLNQSLVTIPLFGLDIAYGDSLSHLRVRVTDVSQDIAIGFIITHETGTEYVVFPKLVSVVGDWTTLETDLGAVWSSGDVLKELGLVFAHKSHSHTYGVSKSDILPDEQVPGTETDILARIGEISLIDPDPSNPPAPPDHHLSLTTSDITDLGPNVEFTLSWNLQDIPIITWEVFVDDEWVGTAFGNAFRLVRPKVWAFGRIMLVGYADGDSEKSVVLVGNWEI
ncbi:mannosyl-glycoprotein endo-beta-N-acetylglucosaminidase [Synchytrium microbalum]|uniref:Mannosyl-glycoprotein endo-beta-N-acetylglucosaminidase n=1 Tax=Synchytrium microbalum TaxID=1806994 RepID=A0A507BM35_9FUNG|nr:mannosyl-glycoprotein endo-beta-N-acetylglucosaminidase [Synchytrium microbalum]TPX31350.1 mannosyl-glycoprotein endo-beta-N-acetylglucosaminidase [Synchytrium microbalum]